MNCPRSWHLAARGVARYLLLLLKSVKIQQFRTFNLSVLVRTLSKPTRSGFFSADDPMLHCIPHQVGCGTQS